jgi:uncharacterized SAM-binding protein YcdF (DUF218 family)
MIPRTPRARRIARWAAIVLVFLMVFTTVAVARLFVWPSEPAVGKANAIVVLSGDHGDRMARALELVRAGVATTLVHAGQPDSAFAIELCAKRKVPDLDVQVVCVLPVPDGTRPEAQAVGNLMRESGWKSVVVVTSAPHVYRTRMLFGRCVTGDLTVVPSRPAFGMKTWIGQLRYELPRVAYFLVASRSC